MPVGAAVGVGALGAGASVYSANAQSNAASDAADAQSQASSEQLALQQQMYENNLHLQQPYYQMGLQGMYGPTGLSNLLGITQPGQTGAAQPAANQNTPTGVAPPPQNAFSQYASGTYGAQTPAQLQQEQQSAEDALYQGYWDANPDLARNLDLSAPHMLNNWDLDGNGQVSTVEAARGHYDTYGQNSNRPGTDAIRNPVQTTPGSSVPATVGIGGGAAQQTVDPYAAQPLTAEPSATMQTGAAEQPIGSMTQTLRQTPGYQFLQDESKNQIENSFASRGKLLSGSAIDALNTRTLGIADQTYQQTVNNAFNLANIGMGSAAQIQTAGSGYANNASTAIGNAANAQANGYYNQANAFSQGLQGVTDSVGAGVGIYGGSQGWF